MDAQAEMMGGKSGGSSSPTSHSTKNGKGKSQTDKRVEEESYVNGHNNATDPLENVDEDTILNHTQ